MSDWLKKYAIFIITPIFWIMTYFVFFAKQYGLKESNEQDTMMIGFVTLALTAMSIVYIKYLRK